MARRLAAILAVALAGAVLAAGCGGSGSPDPVRIGVLVDCVGTLETVHEPVMGAVELPFIRRGARPAGGAPTQGLRGAEVAGHPVEIVEGCTEAGHTARLVAEARRLAEQEGARVIIGPESALGDETVLRRVAARYPDVTFLIAAGTAQEVTLRNPAPNVFRFVPDAVQATAGLGTYAYRTLGWRTAAVVSDPYPTGWEAAAGFVAEFCALGGRVTDRDYSSLYAATPAAAERARAADGVIVLSTAFGDPGRFMALYGRGIPQLSRRVIIGGLTFIDPRSLRWTVDPRGIVVGSLVPLVPNRAAQRDLREFEAAFPGLPAALVLQPVVQAYGRSAEAVAQALEGVDGDLSAGQSSFRRALSGLRLDTASGPIRLDGNRQAVATSHLGRVAGTRAAPAAVPFRAIADVDQTLGGLFSDSTPTPTMTSPGCVRRTPPPWAR
jgi:branched-chain amino acid transport system substrate-binding protein